MITVEILLVTRLKFVSGREGSTAPEWQRIGMAAGRVVFGSDNTRPLYKYPYPPSQSGKKLDPYPYPPGIRRVSGIQWIWYCKI
jgi:hypothetical protein